MWRKWTIVKHRPKEITWAKSTGGLARKVHAIRYMLVAIHVRGEAVQLTVWWCGGSASSEIVPQSHPKIVCANCVARLNKVTEVEWSV